MDDTSIAGDMLLAKMAEQAITAAVAAKLSEPRSESRQRRDEEPPCLEV